ncbi:AMP-binding protein [Hippea alviniae]|uniref:AMP-binding protein n=1 Tax=Hippea alviniae TaxID=1279027 RepID=UPI0012DF6385
MLSYAFEGSTTPFIAKTIGDVLDEAAEKYSNNDCLISLHQNIKMNYREFKEEVDRLAKGLLALGIKKGDKVAIWSTNNVEWVLTQFATAKIGAVLVTVNPAYRTNELEYALKQSEVNTLILIENFKTSDYIDMFYKVAPFARGAIPGQIHSNKLPHLRNVICISDTKHTGMFKWKDVLDMASRVDDSELRDRQKSLDFDDAINIQYTSGTTGFPKAATLSHFNILNNGFFVGEMMKFTDKDRLCIPVPFYHCFGMVMSNLTCVTHGATMVLPSEYFNPLAVLKAVEQEKCTALHGVPTMFIAELEHPDFKKFDLSTLRTGIMAGSPCPVEVMKRVNTEMHMSQVEIAYGQTEASPVITQTPADDTLEHRTETVGRPLPYVEVKIIDPETGKILPVGEQGELCARGYNVMKYYYNNPKATAEAIDEDGWLHTGDLATMTEDGYFKITGRIKDMIIRGGQNIYPREIEEFLYTHPKVADVQVIGVPDRKYGEEVCAWIRLKEGETATEEEIKEYCQGRIAHYKIPKYIKFTDSFPMTVTGKIRKVEMREISIKELGLEDVAKIETA